MRYVNKLFKGLLFLTMAHESMGQHTISMEKHPYKMVPGKINTKNGKVLPEGKSVPFNWNYCLVDTSGIEIRFLSGINAKDFLEARFRIATATDVREEAVLEILLADSDTQIGSIDLSYATYLQVYEWIVPTDMVQSVARQGIKLRQVKGNVAIGIFNGDDKNVSEVFRPHLLYYNEDKTGLQEVEKTLLERDVFQPFGWMEGVVLDGLEVFAQNKSAGKKSIQRRFKAYFDTESFQYTGLNNKPIFNTVMNVETTLPFALYAQYYPDHPALQRALSFCREHQDQNGIISDDPDSPHPIIKTEECYTVSYPLAVIGRQRKDIELQNIALKNLLARALALTDSSGICQRSTSDGGKVYRNWSRGVAWYLLGFIRSWEQLQDHPEAAKIKNELVRAARYTMQFQQENGMWYCFMHEPQTGLETSGTAGIAAALKYGFQIGLLDASADIAANKAIEALKNWLTPDGLLTGTAQVNKGGEALQRNGLRVISPYTLGFWAYLLSKSK